MPKILVVDDSATVLRHVRSVLVSDGYQVITAACGTEAVALLASQRVDLVLTDIYMPDGDGLDVLGALGAEPGNPPAIAMSSEIGPLDLSRAARHLGAKSFLPKPFTADQLLASVRAVIGRPVCTRPRIESLQP